MSSRIPVNQCLKFLEDQVFEAARISFNESQGARKNPPMIDRILQNPIPPKECPGNNGFNINTELDSVFFHPDRFELIVDARGYTPEDLKCVIKKNKVRIVGKIKDVNVTTPWTSKNKRNMNRLYQLPKNVNPNLSFCKLSSDGVLVITAPWIQN